VIKNKKNVVSGGFIPYSEQNMLSDPIGAHLEGKLLENVEYVSRLEPLSGAGLAGIQAMMEEVNIP
jgi:hypothetical protein